MKNSAELFQNRYKFSKDNGSKFPNNQISITKSCPYGKSKKKVLFRENKAIVHIIEKSTI